MLRPLLAAYLLTAASAMAALNVMPLRDVRAGMHGTGKTVFSGGKIEDFQVEILGVLTNTGPQQSIILGKLSGGPLEHTGVLQGMSGSPVYIDGKLVGAVALAFPFAKDPIAGIRPIEEMLSVDSMASAPPRRAARVFDPAGRFEPSPVEGFGDTRMVEVATPVSFGGFTPSAIEHFAAQLKTLGLEPRQGISLGGSPEDRLGDPKLLEPGAMISVELMTGDLSVGADGTLTAIDGNKVYAFGHRFLGVGPTEIPFTRSEVMTLLANVNTSFKISAAREFMGVIGQDRNTAITGAVGRRAATLPLDISVTRSGAKVGNYSMRMVNDRALSPFLLQMAVFSAIDSTERAAGAASLDVRGAIEFEGRNDAVQLRNVYAGDNSTAAIAALSTAIPLSYVMQAGFADLKVKGIHLTIDSSSEKKLMNIGNVWLSRRDVKPGETLDIQVELDAPDGSIVTRTVQYRLPVGTPPGTLNFTVADGAQTSLSELRQVVTETPHSPEQMIATANRLKPSDQAYVRIWRADAAYLVQGEELPEAPPSLALVLNASPAVTMNRNSRVAEIAIPVSGMMLSGAKTAQIEVKEP